MIKALVYLLVFSVLLNNSAMSKQPDVDADLYEEIELNTLRPFFNALESGNVIQLRRYMAGEKLQQANLPQHEDKEYEEFLKEYYRDAVFTIQKASSRDEMIVVDVKIVFPGRGSKVTQFYLNQFSEVNEGDGQDQRRRSVKWRITSQREERNFGY